jgi:hypothetical protein
MRFKAIRKLARRVLFLIAALFCIFAAAMIYFMVHCKATRTDPKVLSQASAARKKASGDLRDYPRTEESTYLTYPEWYIVWSYQEKADFQEKHLPSGFPYFAAIQQYWSGYCCVYGVTRSRYPFNFGDHVMLAVIGTSFSMEYLVKAAYEKSIGKLTEWLSRNEPVDEDRYAYKTARAYADFVHIHPFYEFSFWKRFKGLWQETKAWGPHPIRKWERKLFLSVDYAAEAFYCWLIEKLTHATYGIEGQDTYAWMDNAPDHPRVQRIRQVGPREYLVKMPRYQEFTTVAQQLASQGATFVEIAGNDEIALTILAPKTWQYNVKEGSVLFKTDIPTTPDQQRLEVGAKVSDLHKILNAISGNDAKIEHIYDY